MASICFIAVAVTFYLNSRTSAPPAPVRPASDSLPSASGDAERMWAEMVRSEELIFDFSETMLQLSFAVRNLDLPDERTRPLFWPILSVTDLAPLPDAVAAGMDFSLRSWPVAPPSGDLAGRDLKLWRPLLDEVHHFQNASFKVQRGSFIPGEPEQFEMVVYFAGLARMRSGEWSWVRITQTLQWRLLSGGKEDSAESWRISEWRVDEASPALLAAHPDIRA